MRNKNPLLGIFEFYYIRAFLYLKEKTRQKKQKSPRLYRFFVRLRSMVQSAPRANFRIAKIARTHALGFCVKTRYYLQKVRT